MQKRKIILVNFITLQKNIKMILCLETSTAVCSVALVDKSDVIALRESLDGQNHAEKITIFIDEVMKEAGSRPPITPRICSTA